MRRVLVTGAAGGMGAAIVADLARSWISTSSSPSRWRVRSGSYSTPPTTSISPMSPSGPVRNSSEAAHEHHAAGLSSAAAIAAVCVSCPAFPGVGYWGF